MGKHRKHKSHHRDESKERDRKRRKSHSQEDSSDGELAPKKHRSSHVESHKHDEDRERRSRRREEEERPRMTSYYGDVIEDEPIKSAGHRSDSDVEGDRDGDKAKDHEEEGEIEGETEEPVQVVDREKERDEDKERVRESRRGKDRDGDKERVRESRRGKDRDGDRERERDDVSDRVRESRRGKERDDDRERAHEGRRDYDGDRRRDRDGRRERDHDSDRERNRDEDDKPRVRESRRERDYDGDRERNRDEEDKPRVRENRRERGHDGDNERDSDEDKKKVPEVTKEGDRDSDTERDQVVKGDRDAGDDNERVREGRREKDLEGERERNQDEVKEKDREGHRERDHNEDSVRDRDGERKRSPDETKEKDHSRRDRDRDGDKERDREGRRERDRDGHRDRGREGHRDRDRDRIRERDGDRQRVEGERTRDRDGERHRDRNGDRGRGRDEDRNRDREGDRNRNGERNRDRNRDRSRGRDGDGHRGRDEYEGRRSDRREDRRKDRSRPENSSASKSNQSGKDNEAVEEKPKAPEPVRQPTLGAYIPPAKLRMMQNAIEDKSSASYQRLAWEALKKSLNGLINKVNISNISVIVRELFKENLIRGRGILCRSIMQAQTASPTYTNVFAALVAIINTKFPNIGELLLNRLILQFRRGYKRNDKQACLSAVKFIAHLVNQQVAHEVLALELLTLLLEHPTAHSIEVAIAFLKEVGARLDEVSPKGAHAIFESLRKLLHEGLVEKRVQYMIEVMFQLRKDKYDKFPAVVEELDLVEEEDQFTHMINLDEEIESQDILNIFKLDEEYIANEEKYATLRKEILDESEEESGDEDDDEDESDEEKNEEKAADGTVEIFDKTETNLLALRRTIYLTIQSSLDYEECCHKLMKANLPEGQESELCHMILDCCAQQRTYEKFFGLLAQRFCSINVKYVAPFEEIFKNTYDTVHRLDTNKLRNVAKFFAHLLFTDAISWTILEHIRLTEDETTSSSRIFVKILCQELSEYMGLVKLNERFNEKTLKTYFEGLFPRDNPKNTRFSINFFTSIGLGGLTDELREHLKPKARPEP